MGRISWRTTRPRNGASRIVNVRNANRSSWRESGDADNRRFGIMAGRRIYSQLFVRYWASVPADE
jgi:hypothetical protein